MRSAGGPGNGSLRRTSAIITMLAGALSGALTLTTGLTLPLAFAAVLALAICLGYLLVHSRTPGARRVI
jgi:uncharacterized membrane protein YoaK (UPF0700 family)